MRLRFSSILIAAASIATVGFSATNAHAVGEDEASPVAKGIVGGALLGGEAVMLVEAALDVRPAWAYVVGGIVGGIGGGIGGFFAEQDGDARLPMFLLAGGMVLAIPTTVAVLATTAYKPPADYVQDRAPADEPVAEPPQPSSSEPSTPSSVAPPEPTSRRSPVRSKKRVSARSERLSLYSRHEAVRPKALPSLIGVEQGLVTLSVPAVQVRDVFNRREALQTGVKQATEVRIPVFNFAF